MGYFVSPSGASELSIVTYSLVSPLGSLHVEHGVDKGIEKRCALEFAKTESSVMVQRRIWTKYHTEPHMDKVIN
jgi:hypothetical protein